jgi:hypothetical protein
MLKGSYFNGHKQHKEQRKNPQGTDDLIRILKSSLFKPTMITNVSLVSCSAPPDNMRLSAAHIF